MIKTTTKVFGVFFLLLITFQPARSYGSIGGDLSQCYHAYICFRLANLYWRFAYNIYVGSPLMRILYAIHLSSVLKAKSIQYHWGYHDPTNIFEPLITFKTLEPYPGFARRERRIYTRGRRWWRKLEQEKPELFKEPTQETKVHMLGSMDNCSSVQECRDIMCRAVKNDHSIEKKKYQVIKVFYMVKMRERYFDLKNELRSAKYFDIKCFENPKEVETVEDTRFLTDGAKVEHQEMKMMTDFMFFGRYDVSGMLDNKKHRDVDEIKEDGTTLDDVIGHKEVSDDSPVEVNEFGAVVVPPEDYDDENMGQVMDTVF